MKVQNNDTHRVSSLGTHGRLSKPVEVGNEYDVEVSDRGKSRTDRIECQDSRISNIRQGRKSRRQSKNKNNCYRRKICKGGDSNS